MSKITKATVNGAIIGGGVGLAFDAISQLIEMADNKHQEFDWERLLFSGGTGLLKGAAVGFGIGVLSEFFAEDEMDEEDFDEVKYLETVLQSYEPDHIDKITLKKGFAIKNKLWNYFRHDLLGKPKFQGSMSNGTAISGVSDLDIRVQFKKTSFQTLEHMYNAVLDYFENSFYDSELMEVRPQKRSIGLLYEIEGEQVCIDIVPGKRTNFEKGGNDYHLYENSSGWFGKPSRVKMNPYKQANFGTQKAAKATVVSLLKILRNAEGLPMKSVLLRELSKSALDNHKGKIPKEIDKQFLLALRYIRDNIEYRRVVSPDNSNNVLSDLLTKNEKRKIADKLDYIIQEIDQNPQNFRYYLPMRND